jgi:hypothetical protein
MPRKAKATVQLVVRVPSEWVRRADALTDQVMPIGVEITRTDVVRMAIAEGLDTLEMRRKKTAKGATS